MKRSTWILLALVLAAAAFIFIWERKQKGTSEKEDLALALFQDFPENDAVSRLERTGEDPLVLVRLGDEEWKMESPLGDIADPLSVEGFMDRIRDTRAERFIEEPVPWNDLGLDPPASAWTIRSADSEWTISLGSQAALEAGVYVRAGEKAALVSSTLEDTLGRKPGEFRSRDLIPLEAGKVREFTLSVGGETVFSAARSGDGWWIREPFEDHGDRWKMDGYLDQWCLASVESFNEDPEAVSEEDPPEWVMLFTDGEGKTLTVAAAGPGAVRVDGRPSPMAVTGRLFEALNPDPESFRSMRLFGHPSYDADEVSVSGAYSEHLERGEQGGWVFGEESSAPDGKDGVPLAETLLNLAGTEAVPADDPESLGLAPPYLSIALKGEGFEERVAVGVQIGGIRYARPAGRPVALLLSPEEWERAEAALKAVPLAPEPSEGAAEPVPPLETP